MLVRLEDFTPILRPLHGLQCALYVLLSEAEGHNGSGLLHRN